MKEIKCYVVTTSDCECYFIRATNINEVLKELSPLTMSETCWICPLEEIFERNMGANHNYINVMKDTMTFGEEKEVP